MPARSLHTPNTWERTILQAIITNDRNVGYLASAHKVTLSRMIEKGWVTQNGEAFVVTDDGRRAMIKRIERPLRGDGK